jgi:hypothetical protein
MEKILISEINRMKEIMGLRLLKESWGDELTDYALFLFKNGDDVISANKELESLVNAFKTEADKAAKNAGFENDVLGYLSKLKSGNEGLPKVLNDMILVSIKNNPAIRKKLITTFIETSPVLKQIETDLVDTSFQDLIKDIKKTQAGIDEINSAVETVKSELKTKTFDGENLSDEIIADFEKRIDDAAQVKRDEIFDILKKESDESEESLRIAEELGEKAAKEAEQADLNKAKELLEKAKQQINVNKSLSVDESKLERAFESAEKGALTKYKEFLELQKAGKIKSADEAAIEYLVGQLKIPSVRARVNTLLSKLKGFPKGFFQGLFKTLSFAGKGKKILKGGFIIILLTLLGFAGNLAIDYLVVSDAELDEASNRLYSTCEQGKITIDNSEIREVTNKAGTADIGGNIAYFVKYNGELVEFIDDNGTFVRKDSTEGGRKKVYLKDLCKDPLLGALEKTIDTPPIIPADTGLTAEKITAIKNDFITSYGNGTPKIKTIDVIDEKNVTVAFEDGTSFPYDKNSGTWK